MALFQRTEDYRYNNEGSYAFSAMQGAAASARAHRDSYVQTVNESTRARAVFEGAENTYWSVMSNVQNTWARINERLN